MTDTQSYVSEHVLSNTYKTSNIFFFCALGFLPHFLKAYGCLNLCITDMVDSKCSTGGSVLWYCHDRVH